MLLLLIVTFLVLMLGSAPIAVAMGLSAILDHVSGRYSAHISRAENHHRHRFFPFCRHSRCLSWPAN